MKPAIVLPKFKTLPFDKRHLITDVMIEQEPGEKGRFLFDTARCTTGDGQIYRIAPTDLDVVRAVEAGIEGEIDTLLEWAYFFITEMHNTLTAEASLESALRDRRLVFSYDMKDSTGKFIETLRFRVVKVKKLVGPHMFAGREGGLTTPWVWRYQMRRIPAEIPTLQQLRYTNPLIRELLMLSEFNGNGILAFAGKKFNGKSTSAIATVAARCERYANQFFSIENPPEFEASGWFGQGEVCQVFLDPSKPIETAISEGLRDVVQSFSTQTAGGGPGLFYGEASDRAMVGSMLENANDGTLVVCTGHSQSASSFPQHLLDVGAIGMTREAACSAIASGLRLVVHQTLSITDKITEGYWERGSINAQILYSPDHASKAANAIRNGDNQTLEEIAQRQTKILDEQADAYLRLADSDDDRSAFMQRVMGQLRDVVSMRS